MPRSTPAAAESVDLLVSRRAKTIAPPNLPHICICLCAYKRPQMLTRLLGELARQETGGLFTHSVVIVDNDEAESSRPAVEDFLSNSTLPIKYIVEPRRGINAARNASFANADGEYIAIIDDDELPAANWLLTLFKTLNKSEHVDGVLGPVLRLFDETPPKWLERSRLYVRRINPTGMRVDWHEARTGNVLLRRSIVAGQASPFREDVAYGGDQEFFRRLMASGRTFIWSAEGCVHEIVPPARWKLSYLLKKALLRGDSSTRRGGFGIVSLSKSLIAMPLYVIALPAAHLLGQHHAITLLVKLCDHAGKAAAYCGIHFVKGVYVSEPGK